jgi:hypothetical protein
MLKPVIAATAVLAIAGSSYVFAQQGPDGRGAFGNGGPRAEQQHHRLSADDVTAFTDARIAALKAGLELTPDQAKNWPAFESALRNMAQLRIQRMQARQAARQQNQTQAQTPTSPFERLGRRADAMTKMSAALKQIADTGAPLYQSLTDQQKSRFTILARMLRPHQHRQGMNGGWRQGRGQDGHGWGRDGRRFGQNGDGWRGHRFAQNGQGWGQGDRQFGENGRGPGGRMHHHMMDRDGDQGSQL